MPKGLAWTRSDLALLYRLYPTSGANPVAEMLGRTRRAIITRAAQLGVRYERAQKYSGDERVCDDPCGEEYERRKAAQLALRVHHADWGQRGEPRVYRDPISVYRS
jgi:hypothetical protein